MITLPILSATSGIRHGFFTRQGGVSTGMLSSLNCGFGAEDTPHNVAENRARVAALLGCAPEALVSLHQIHSPRVVTVESPWPISDRPQADGMVTARRGVGLGILTADCVPVLFADTEAAVIGAAHAGWKGALHGVLAATVTAMTRLGGRVETMRVAIGPAIQQASYEVGAEFVERIVSADADWARFATPAPRADHFLFDLPGLVEQRLRDLGIRQIERTPLDTLTNEEMFFSYRRATLRGERDYGRGLSAIMLT